LLRSPNKEEQQRVTLVFVLADDFAVVETQIQAVWLWVRANQRTKPARCATFHHFGSSTLLSIIMFRILASSARACVRSYHRVPSKSFKIDPKKYDLVLDVREPAELAGGFIEGSVLAPLSRFEQDVAQGAFNEYKSKNVMVYCRSGRRSLSGSDILEKAGFANVTSMDGGYEEYKTLP
jgi:rhodanese-related sulfurtransferase